MTAITVNYDYHHFFDLRLICLHLWKQHRRQKEFLHLACKHHHAGQLLDQRRVLVDVDGVALAVLLIGLPFVCYCHI